MKKTFANIRTLAAVLMASAALVACNKEHNATAEQTPQVYTLTIQAGMNDGTQTKALELDGTKLVAKWEEGETVEVRKGATLLGNLTVSNVSADGQSCTLSGTLTGDIRREDIMRLYYHHTGLVNESQTGTLASAAESDYAVARVEVDSVNGDIISLKSNPSFETQVAMLKLTMKDGSANLLNATSLQITIGDIAPYTFSPTDATYTANGDGVVYFALPSASRLSADSGTSLDVAGLAAASVTFTATVGADTYTVTKTGYAFAAGKYYATTLTMAEAEPLLLTTITATGKEQADYSTANVATVSFSYTAGGSSAYLANWGWWGYGWSATVTAAEGYTITKCIFYDDANRTATDSEAPFVVETTEEDKTPKVNGTPIQAWTSKGIKKIEVYGYVTPTA